MFSRPQTYRDPVRFPSQVIPGRSRGSLGNRNTTTDPALDVSGETGEGQVQSPRVDLRERTDPLPEINPHGEPWWSASHADLLRAGLCRLG